MYIDWAAASTDVTLEILASYKGTKAAVVACVLLLELLGML